MGLTHPRRYRLGPNSWYLKEGLLGLSVLLLECFARDLALTANNEILAEKSEVYEESAIICNVVLISLLACLGSTC